MSRANSSACSKGLIQQKRHRGKTIHIIALQARAKASPKTAKRRETDQDRAPGNVSMRCCCAHAAAATSWLTAHTACISFNGTAATTLSRTM